MIQHTIKTGFRYKGIPFFYMYRLTDGTTFYIYIYTHIHMRLHLFINAYNYLHKYVQSVWLNCSDAIWKLLGHQVEAPYEIIDSVYLEVSSCVSCSFGSDPAPVPKGPGDFRHVWGDHVVSASGRYAQISAFLERPSTQGLVVSMVMRQQLYSWLYI